MASSSNRNPKDLKDLIEKSKREAELDEIEQALHKLRNIPEADKTESGLLRARIEEQSRLIMILKNRGDEYIRKHVAVEKLNKELLEERDKYLGEVRIYEQKCDLLHNRFNDLAENHQELIKIKDEYKRTNVILVEENQKIKKELSHFSSNQEMRESELLSRISSLTDTCKLYEKNLQELNDKLHVLSELHKEEISKKESEAFEHINMLEMKLKSYDRKVEELNNLIRNYEDELKNNEVKMETKLREITKEKDELLELTIKRGKLIQEKQNENKKLSDRVVELEKLVANLKEKFELECERVDSNLQIQKLKYELSQMETANRQLTLEYEAFRKHSLSQLEREKELNSKLRFLVS